jgi:hypothetical protein
MRLRRSRPFPPASLSFNFPKENQSYKLVSVFATCALTTRGKQVILALNDGVGNPIAAWSSETIDALAAPIINMTFSASAVNSNVVAPGLAVSGQHANVSIPSDLWINPQWTLQLTINPNDAGDGFTQLMLQTEAYDGAQRKIPLPRSLPSQDS